MVFLTQIKNGNLSFNTPANEARFLDWAKNNEGKRLRLEHEEPKRSYSQNNYYWVYLKIIAEETGNIEMDLHEFFKRKLLPPKYIRIKGKMSVHEVKVPQSTTDLSKADFGEYISKIEAMTGVPAPDPEEAGYFTGKMTL